MDDYFSGLIRPHIDEMKLDEEDWGSVENREGNEQHDSNIAKSNDDESDKESPTIVVDTVDVLSAPDVDVTPELVHTSKNNSSTSSSSSNPESVEGPSTLEDFRMPMINYQRDYPQQTLVGVIGREFDEPWTVSASLQALCIGTPIDDEPTARYPTIKFVPYTIRRSVLVKGRFDSQDIIKHDVICMCYNASEARIMLTGNDGYYTQLLKHVEALLGSNRGVFLITHYVSPGKEDVQNNSHVLISPELKERLQVQKELMIYLQDGQVMSWYDKPFKWHITKLQSIAKTETNPRGYMHCTLL